MQFTMFSGPMRLRFSLCTNIKVTTKKVPKLLNKMMHRYVFKEKHTIDTISAKMIDSTLSSNHHRILHSFKDI